MKLARYGAVGEERPAIIGNDGRLRDLSSLIWDIAPNTLGDDQLAMSEAANIAGD